MGLKVEVNKKEVKSYPKLMESGGLVVLFMAASKGTVLLGGSVYQPVGYYSIIWDMDIFKNFEGEITIKNS
jgi:hypothetical protein